MLSRILHWIYCLPLEQAVVLALVATGLFFWGYHRWRAKVWWRITVIVMLLCWALAAFGVMFARDYGVRQLSLIPLRTYVTAITKGDREPLRSAFMNVLLFYPGGLLTASLCPQRKRFLVVVSFCLLSIGVEVGQYFLSVGVTETDDVLHNTLGTLLGLLALKQYEKHNIGNA